MRQYQIRELQASRELKNALDNRAIRQWLAQHGHRYATDDECNTVRIKLINIQLKQRLHDMGEDQQEPVKGRGFIGSLVHKFIPFM